MYVNGYIKWSVRYLGGLLIARVSWYVAHYTHSGKAASMIISAI